MAYKKKIIFYKQINELISENYVFLKCFNFCNNIKSAVVNFNFLPIPP